MRYIIIKTKNDYIITTQQAYVDYKKTGFLPYDIAMKYKKYLIEYAKKHDKYKNLDKKTIFLY